MATKRTSMPRARAADPQATAAARSLAGLGGRLSVDYPSTLIGNPRVILAPTEPEDSWRTLDLDSDTIKRVPAHRILELLADLSPEHSRALWDTLRMTNPGWEAHALKPGTEEIDPDAQPVLDAFFDRLTDLYGTADVPINRLFIGAVLRGAMLAELVLDANGRDAVDLATPDPVWVRFKLETDDVRGQHWVLGQLQGNDFVPLDRPTVRYVPIDPFPGQPYGRPMFSPAMFTALFLLGLLHDLRRVVSQQGYPRLDLSIDLAQLLSTMPEEWRGDIEKVQEWAQATVDAVKTAYQKLEPDHAYVHTSVVSVNRPVGTVDASSLGAIDALVKALERMATRGLKTMPLLMGTAEGTSEANANRQWEIHNAGVKSLQHGAETILGRLCGLVLQAAGKRATGRFRFAELREAEMMRDQQTRRLRDLNNAFEEMMGWVSHDEAALDAVGHAAAEPAPLATPSGFATGADAALNDNPDPGSGRAAPWAVIGHGRVPLTVHGEPLPLVPGVAVEIDDLTDAADAWDARMNGHAGLLDAEVITGG